MNKFENLMSILLTTVERGGSNTNHLKIK